MWTGQKDGALRRAWVSGAMSSISGSKESRRSKPSQKRRQRETSRPRRISSRWRTWPPRSSSFSIRKRKSEARSMPPRSSRIRNSPSGSGWASFLWQEQLLASPPSTWPWQAPWRSMAQQAGSCWVFSASYSIIRASTRKEMTLRNGMIRWLLS